MKRLFLLLIALLPVLLSAPISQAKTVRIGLIYDGFSPRFPRAEETFYNEIRNITRGEHEVVFPIDAQIDGKWRVKEINRGLDRLLASNQVDMVVMVGFVSAHEACRRRNLSKPVFAANVWLGKKPTRC